MTDVWTMGELLVEIMRPRPDVSFREPDWFRGPYPSGAPGIFIDTIARLGHSAAIISGVGSDEFGECIVGRLRADGVRTDHIEIVDGASTGVAFVAYERDGSRRYIFHWEGTPAVMAPVPSAYDLEGAKIFHVMGCSLLANDSFRERIFMTVELAGEAGARITFDPNVRRELLHGRNLRSVVDPVLNVCSVLLPGEQELLDLAGERGVDAAAKALLATTRIELIVLKRGARGCRLISRDGTAEVPAYPVPEVDPTGAGDSFDAGFVCGMLEGTSPVESARLGAAAGALTAAAFGPMEGRTSRAAVTTLMQETVSS